MTIDISPARQAGGALSRAARAGYNRLLAGSGRECNAPGPARGRGPGRAGRSRWCCRGGGPRLGHEAHQTRSTRPDPTRQPEPTPVPVPNARNAHTAAAAYRGVARRRHPFRESLCCRPPRWRRATTSRGQSLLRPQSALYPILLVITVIYVLRRRTAKFDRSRN